MGYLSCSENDGCQRDEAAGSAEPHGPARQARRSPQEAARLQRRASLMGGAKWRITNLDEVARAIARWP